MVHSGFVAAYDSVKAKVLALVDEVIRNASEDEPWQARLAQLGCVHVAVCEFLSALMCVCVCQCVIRGRQGCLVTQTR